MSEAGGGGLVSKQTVMLQWWGSETQRYVFIS